MKGHPIQEHRIRQQEKDEVELQADAGFVEWVAIEAGTEILISDTLTMVIKAKS